MAELDFNTYKKQYKYIIKKEKLILRKSNQNFTKIDVKGILSEYDLLKEELGNLEKRMTSSLSNKEDILIEMDKNEEHINKLITLLEIYKNDLLKSKKNYFFEFMLNFNNLDLLYFLLNITLCFASGLLCGILINLINCLIFQINYIFSNTIIWGFISSIILDGIFSKIFENSQTMIKNIYQFIISQLPLHNKYSFIKLALKLKKLKQNNNELKQIYEKYVKYITDVNPAVKTNELDNKPIEVLNPSTSVITKNQARRRILKR